MSQAMQIEDVQRVPLDEAKKRFDEGSTLFVDVRGAEDYEKGHIAGALSIPLAGSPERYWSLPRDRDVILY